MVGLVVHAMQLPQLPRPLLLQPVLGAQRSLSPYEVGLAASEQEIPQEGEVSLGRGGTALDGATPDRMRAREKHHL